MALVKGRFDVAKYLINTHQCVIKRDNRGNTPLHSAAEDSENLDVVKFLTKKLYL